MRPSALFFSLFRLSLAFFLVFFFFSGFFLVFLCFFVLFSHCSSCASLLALLSPCFCAFSSSLLPAPSPYCIFIPPSPLYISWGGGNFAIPFSFFYVIGLLLGLIVLLTKTHPFGLSLAAGICMFLGVIGGVAGVELMEFAGELAEKTVEIHGGIGFAFVWSIIYTVAGSIIYVLRKRGKTI